MPASVRYIVDDVDAAIVFYTNLLGFAVEKHPALGFAVIARDGLRLTLSQLEDGGRLAAPDGQRLRPGGSNRIQIEVDDLSATVKRLEKFGATFRSDIVVGFGALQILMEDPSGNPIELFEPMRV